MRTKTRAYPPARLREGNGMTAAARRSFPDNCHAAEPPSPRPSVTPAADPPVGAAEVRIGGGDLMRSSVCAGGERAEDDENDECIFTLSWKVRFLRLRFNIGEAYSSITFVTFWRLYALMTSTVVSATAKPAISRI
jgi:hypothetical protein